MTESSLRDSAQQNRGNLFLLDSAESLESFCDSAFSKNICVKNGLLRSLRSLAMTVERYKVAFA